MTGTRRHWTAVPVVAGGLTWTGWAAGLVRARRLPPWIGVSLFVGTVLFLGFNREPALALPAGLAWVAVGNHLWR